MPIQLTITGNHTTDLLAEIKGLAEALLPKEQTGLPFEPDVRVGMVHATELTENTMNESVSLIEEPNENPDVEHEPVTQELDGMGLLWDERIHSSNKKKTSKGVWTRRRGIQDADFDKIVAELKGEEVQEEVIVEEEPEVIEEVKAEPVVTEPVTVTFDSLRALMAEKGRPNGKDDPKALVQIRQIMANAIPAGTDVKISNIPEDLLKCVYDDIGAI